MTVKELIRFLNGLEDKEYEVKLVHDEVSLGSPKRLGIDTEAKILIIGN